MEQQFEIVDRDHSEKFEGVTSRDRGITEKIKLTEQSRNNMVSKFEKAVGQKVTEKPINEVINEEVENKENNVELIGVSQSDYEVSRVIPTSKKAIKFAEYMVENTDNKYSEAVPQINVDNVDTNEIEESINNSFDFYNINQPEEIDTNSVSNDYEPSEDYEQPIEEESTLDNLVSSQEETYDEPYYAGEEEITPNVEENEETYSTEPEKVNESIVPEIQDYFASHDIEGSINDEFDNEIVETDEKTYEQPSLDLYSEVDSVLNDSSSTILDLNEVREKLQNERARKARLTQELEEKQMEAAQAEREEQEALREQEAMIMAYNDEYSALINENEGLEEQTRIIEEKTQETNSNVVSIRDYVSALESIMNESSYGQNSGEKTASEGKARVA